MKKFDPEIHGCRKCFWLGHVYSENGDGCVVCWMPNYMIEEGYALLPWFWGKLWELKCFYWRFRRWLWTRCDDPTCNKVEFICGVKVGKHDKCECIPF